MAFRRTTRFRRGGPKKQAVWVNIPFQGVTFTETVGGTELMVAEAWEAQFTGLAYERAVIKAIRGYVTVQQGVVGTNATSSAYWGLYLADGGGAITVAFTVSGMSEVRWLHTAAVGVAGTLVTQTSAAIMNFPIDVRAKARITSRDSLYIAGQVGTDAASPGFTLGGLLRVLVARD